MKNVGVFGRQQIKRLEREKGLGGTESRENKMTGYKDYKHMKSISKWEN